MNCYKKKDMPKHASYNDANLHIYKASAGSGKTYRLTAEYLRLLFTSASAYKHILAVTFTNKATDEMKSRIVNELAKLATDKPSDYTDMLMEEHSISEDQVRAKSRQILTDILHDYSAFSVSTIDRFFQQTMRAFTREIGIGGGYNVELDTTSVLDTAIDNMLLGLEKDDSKQLLDWLIRFSEEKIENGETWNIRNDIQSLSDEIFKESYKVSRDLVQADISDKALMESYKDMLHECISSFRKKLQELAEKGINILTRYDLSPDDMKGGSRSPFNMLLKWANGEMTEPSVAFLNLESEITNWYTAKTSAGVRNKIEQAYDGGLNACICEIIAHFGKSQIYQTACEINRYFFTLGILGDIDKKIREYTAENNLMLISDTTELLYQIIQGSDAPFIYEKTGLRVTNYMIDEFQDTSRMQWENFRPLVSDSLSQGNRNFIVGDVKQSIYRWRNSDWKLLDEQLDYDFRPEEIRHESLDTNWRSTYNVIAFNNAIFSIGAKLLQDQYNSVLPQDNSFLNETYASRILKAYSDAYQQTPVSRTDDKGHVKINFIDTTEYDWQSYVLEQLPIQIEELQDKGYRLKDIAILVRTKKEGAEVANCLLEYKNKHESSKYRYDIISDEALYLDNAKSIKLIIALLRYIHSPADKSLRTLAIFEYLKSSNGIKAEDALRKYFSDNEDLPSDVKDIIGQIGRLPLYDMTEGLFRLFADAMEENEQIYIQSFLDLVLDYTVRHSSDLDAFLRWWDETGVKKTIFTPDGQDAIRIMTIHKSKGLGFDVVLVPFCNWEIDHRMTTILWCQPQEAPFNNLHLVPVKYSQKLKNTIFEKEYFEERLHAFIDNFNVLYVAFTRAKKELIAFAPKPKKGGVSSISSLLWECINSTPQTSDNTDIITNLSESLDDETSIFEMGEDYRPKSVQNSSEVKEISVGNLPSIPFDEKLQLLLKNKYFFSEKGDRDYGVLMHEIISKIQTAAQIDDAVEEYVISGDLTESEKTEVIGLLRNYLSLPVVSDWYSDAYTVLNEVQILQPNGKFVRPDRVMINDRQVVVIDYKFGHKEEKKYIRQVKYYADQIRKMGYNDVKGFISYITLGKIIEVE